MLRRTKHQVDDQATQRRVLVVNDDDDAGEVLCRVLFRAGYEVERAYDHLDAIARLTGSALDCVLLDLATGGIGTNLKLLDAIRTHSDSGISNARVVLIAKQTNNRMFSWQAGVDGFLVRPFHADDLVRDIGDAIDRPDDERAVHRRRQLHEAQGAGRTAESRPWDGQRF